MAKSRKKAAAHTSHLGTVGDLDVTARGDTEFPDSESVSRAKAKSWADWNRCSGFFSRQRRTTFCIPGGTVGMTCEMAGGSSLRMAFIVSIPVARRKALLPEIIS